MQMHSVETNSGNTTSPALLRMASRTGSPLAMRRLQFSISTSALSTRMPMASARPPSVIRLKVMPLAYRQATEPSSASGIEVSTTSVERRLPMNNSTTAATSKPTSTASYRTLRTAARTNTLWSNSGSMRMPGGAAARISGSRAST